MQVREFYAGMGQAVAERTILRKKDNGEWESWGDVADRVALGNSLLDPNRPEEYELLKKHLSKATILMSGRHLQHGDADQPNKSMELYTNCSTSPTSFLLFSLLMQGSGVGRCYDDDMMLVDWDNAPNLRCVLDSSHPDFDYSAHESVRDAEHKYGHGKDVLWHSVDDTREGWAKALEIWENAAFEKIHKDKMLILDFSKVRPKGSPIKGLQNRPASGPVPLLNAMMKCASLKGAGLARWKQSMFIDHNLSECVLVGGARRSARMSTKTWRDSTVIDFINVKRPIEYHGKTVEEISEFRKTNSPFSFLWSSNNSVMVDQVFWKLVKIKKGEEGYNDELTKWARKVFNAICDAAYGDGTGEPGIINQDKLNQNNEGLNTIPDVFISSQKYTINDDTQVYLRRLLKVAKKKKYYMITNPCGELNISMFGGFCVIADNVPYHADTLEEAEEAFRASARALIRVNTMDSVYKHEVNRTNRIGVGMTGVFEFAWKFFKFGFKDLIDEEKSIEFWKTISRFKKAVQDECKCYSNELGLNTPHTDTTIKPAGTTSKLFGLTEGWHLPTMGWYIRWVQFSKDDPLVKVYQEKGYEIKSLSTYKDTVIVGFPTTLELSKLDLGDKFVIADEATPEEQYKWLMLGEKYWIRGVVDGQPLEDTGSQISYTLKYNPKLVDLKSFKQTLMEYQSQIKCCSVMPKEDKSSYEYLPEQMVTKGEYESILSKIQQIKEDIGREHVLCDGGACPVDFTEGKKND